MEVRHRRKGAPRPTDARTVNDGEAEAVATEATFRFDYNHWGSTLLWAMFMGESRTSVVVTADRLRVGFGWGFSCDVPLSAVGAVERVLGDIAGLSIGAHTDMEGSWLVSPVLWRCCVTFKLSSGEHIVQRPCVAVVRAGADRHGRNGLCDPEATQAFSSGAR